MFLDVVKAQSPGGRHLVEMRHQVILGDRRQIREWRRE